MKHISIRVGKILSIYAIRHNEKLYEVVQSIVGMLFVAHYLIDSLSNINASPFQLNLNEGKTIDKDRHIVTIDILADNGCLIRHLKDVLRVVGIKKREVHFCSVLTLQHELISEDFCALKNGFPQHDIHDALPFLVCQGVVKLRCIEGFKLGFEVFYQCIIVRY